MHEIQGDDGDVELGDVGEAGDRAGGVRVVSCGGGSVGIVVSSGSADKFVECC